LCILGLYPISIRVSLPDQVGVGFLDEGIAAMTWKIPLTIATVSALTLAGCAQNHGAGGGTQIGDSCGDLGWGRVVGGLGGAVGGGYLGSRWQGAGRSTQTTATIAGTALGALAGVMLGGNVDDNDCNRAQQARTQALTSAPVGQPIVWNNPSTGNQGTFVATRDGTAANGAYCREYQQTIVVGGEQKQAFGTACRQPDGSWKMQP
jgi:surface antigen